MTENNYSYTITEGVGKERHEETLKVYTGFGNQKKEVVESTNAKAFDVQPLAQEISSGVTMTRLSVFPN